jgi:hypothetical protein
MNKTVAHVKNMCRQGALPFLALCALALLFESAVRSQTPSQTLSVPPDSPRWELEGQAKVAEYQGRKHLFLDGGAATVKDFEMRDGVVDGCPLLMSTAAADSAVTSTGDVPSAA